MPGPPVFRPFNEAGEVRVYVRNLPHWRQPGATYFVTFRQDDSIPASVLAQWRDERQRWYRGTVWIPAGSVQTPADLMRLTRRFLRMSGKHLNASRRGSCTAN